MTKKMIKEELTYLDVSCVNVEDVIKTLQSYVDKYGAGNVSLERKSEPYDGGEYIAIFIKKLETDEQESKRELEEKLYEQRAKDMELLQYEALKKKFGDK